MPIIHVQAVVSDTHTLPSDTTQILANQLAKVLQAKAGTVWVRLTEFPKCNYAENETTVSNTALPVFVEILHADWPEVAQRAAEASTLAAAVANILGRKVEQVHIEYAQPARGRIAFGGKLVT